MKNIPLILIPWDLQFHCKCFLTDDYNIAILTQSMFNSIIQWNVDREADPCAPLMHADKDVKIIIVTLKSEDDFIVVVNDTLRSITAFFEENPKSSIWVFGVRHFIIELNDYFNPSQCFLLEQKNDTPVSCIIEKIENQEINPDSFFPIPKESEELICLQ